MSEPAALGGLIAAAHTPMRSDGALDLEGIGPLVEHLVGEGVSGLYVLGSTGEGPSLSQDERMAAAERFVRASAGRLPVVVQVGHHSVAEARTLAAHAARVGADAVSATPPSYFKPQGVEALAATMAQIASAAPELPFYYYHMPAATGVTCDLPALLEAVGARAASFAGVKYTAPTLDEYLACTQVEAGRFNMLFGRDEMLLAALAVGARGAVGSTYNFAAPLYRRLIAAFERSDLAEARRCQALAVGMIRTILSFGVFESLKAMMQIIGVDCGPPRLPVMPLSPERVDALRAALESIGFFQWGRQEG